MWPDSAFPNLYWGAYMTTLITVQYYQYAYIFEHFDINNLWLLMDCLSLTLAYSHIVLKLLVLMYNRRIIYFMVRAIVEDWNESLANDSYKSTMTNMADISRRFSNTMFCAYICCAFFMSIGGYVLQAMSEANEPDNNKSRELPIKMAYPFDTSKSPIFECFLIEQFLYDMVLALLVGLVNALLVALILHVSGQIDIMQQDLLEIYNKKYDPSTFLLLMKDFICKHQKIITYSENIESLFTVIALMQVLWNTLVMCSSGFVIVTIISSGENTSTLVKPLIFYTLITLEVFVYCYAGEFLSAKSKAIGDAIYESLWYNLPPSDCCIILIMMLRCQKRLTLTAGKVVDLNLEGFTSVVKASASYVSVLNAMS
ncbi:hypothetical protein PUN28_012803 [Cardiocondyla obscurior]